ncbi:MAG: hypothetical protein JHC84_07050 [Solirubrobacteraceae bacterium]|nr:hypothetical protein [Solirubrobacteraceae bacterium]
MDIDRAPGSSATLITVRSLSGETDTDRFSRLGRVVATNRDDDIVTTVPASVSGGPGDDIIDGSDGDDTLYGDEGDDAVFGGAGRDQLFGGSAALPADPLRAPSASETRYDYLHVEDGGPDQAYCADGWDVVIADAAHLDGADGNCEEVIRPDLDPISTPMPVVRPRPVGGWPPPVTGSAGKSTPAAAGQPPLLRLGHRLVKLRRPGKVTVKGRALNADRTPITGVRVTLKRGARVLASTRAGKDGSFKLRARVTRTAKLSVSYADPVTRRRVSATVTVRVKR